jgi:hypothetical protein
LSLRFDDIPAILILRPTRLGSLAVSELYMLNWGRLVLFRKEKRPGGRGFGEWNELFRRELWAKSKRVVLTRTRIEKFDGACVLITFALTALWVLKIEFSGKVAIVGTGIAVYSVPSVFGTRSVIG